MIVYGSLFTKSVAATEIEVHFDRAITDAGKDCAPPPVSGPDAVIGQM
jgi:hypothetical protein